MRTTFKIDGVSDRLQRYPGRIAVIAAGTPSVRIQRAREQFTRGRGIYNAKTQPRNYDGRFRKILARLKSNLGDSELEQINKEIHEIEQAHDAGDYAKTSNASKKVIGLIDDIQTGTLDRAVEKNLREGAADLGRVMAYLPLPQGENAAKVRFSDLPPSTGRLVQGLIKRIEDEINPKDAAKFTKVLKSFISGVRTMSSDEISAEMNKLLRLLSD
jgi:hypothetical protein